MLRVSVYVKGNRNAPTYYRIYQYFDRIDDCHFKYRKMYAEWVHDWFMPFSRQPFFIKVFAQIHALLRTLVFLISDCLTKPDVIVVHRRVITRFMPKIFVLLLRKIAKHTKIIWDFDDNIIENKEVSNSTFALYAEVSSIIVLTSNFLKDLVPEMYQQKVFIMPTTDGDMYQHYSSNLHAINAHRADSFANKIELVWVATSVNLKYLFGIIGELDAVAQVLKERYSKELALNVVCNQSLLCDCKYLIINNIKWTHEIAIETIYKSHIGIMPLEDNEFTRGKGGFKLIQYMSAGLPCIASDVGYNNYVVSSGMGRLVTNKREWQDAILFLSQFDVWSKCSQVAYREWLDKFSFERNMNNWRKFIHKVIN